MRAQGSMRGRDRDDRDRPRRKFGFVVIWGMASGRKSLRGFIGNALEKTQSCTKDTY